MEPKMSPEFEIPSKAYGFVGLHDLQGSLSEVCGRRPPTSGLKPPRALPKPPVEPYPVEAMWPIGWLGPSVIGEYPS